MCVKNGYAKTKRHCQRDAHQKRDAAKRLWFSEDDSRFSHLSCVDTRGKLSWEIKRKDKEKTQVVWDLLYFSAFFGKNKLRRHLPLFIYLHFSCHIPFPCLTSTPLYLRCYPFELPTSSAVHQRDILLYTLHCSIPHKKEWKRFICRGEQTTTFFSCIKNKSFLPVKWVSYSTKRSTITLSVLNSWKSFRWEVKCVCNRYLIRLMSLYFVTCCISVRTMAW